MSLDFADPAFVASLQAASPPLPQAAVDFNPATFGFVDGALYGFTDKPANTGSLVGLYGTTTFLAQPTFRATGGPNGVAYSDGIAGDLVTADWGNAPTQFLHGETGAGFVFAMVTKKGPSTLLSTTRYGMAVTRTTTGLGRGLVMMNDGTALLRKRYIIYPVLDLSFGVAVQEQWESEVLVYDDVASEFRCYVNGVLEATVPRAGSFSTGVSQLDLRIHYGNDTQVARVLAWESVVDVDAVHALIATTYGIGAP